MAINNDMVIAVAAEDNDKDATEFAIYNTVGFSLGFRAVPRIHAAHASSGPESSGVFGAQLVPLFPVRLQGRLRLLGDRSRNVSLVLTRMRSHAYSRCV